MSDPRPEPQRRNWEAVAGGAVFAIGLALATARVGLSFTPGTGKVGAGWVMIDFFSSAYYPVRALLEGGNPHDRAWFLHQYPVADMYGPFLPVNLLIHLPFGLLPPWVAGLLYFSLTVLLTLVLGVLSLRLAGVSVTASRTALVGGLILLSRPGHWTLLLGQSAILLSCLAYLALLRARSSPIQSGFALALATFKPTFGIPLGIMMLARRHLKAVIAGVIISLVVNLPLLWLLASRAGGMQAFIATGLAGIREWQAHPGTDPSANHRQVDAAALIGRFLGHSLSGGAEELLGLGLLAIAALAVRRLDQDDPTARDLFVAITCTAVLISGHHLGYDMVILAAPLVSLVVRGLPPGAPSALRSAFLALYVVPAVNWVSTDAVMESWRPAHVPWLLVSSINGFCVAVLFVGYVGLAFAYRARSTLMSPAHPSVHPA